MKLVGAGSITNIVTATATIIITSISSSIHDGSSMRREEEEGGGRRRRRRRLQQKSEPSVRGTGGSVFTERTLQPGSNLTTSLMHCV